MEYCSNKLQGSQKKRPASALIPQPATQQVYLLLINILMILLQYHHEGVS